MLMKYSTAVKTVPPGNNAVGFINEKNDELLEAGRREFDQEKRKKYMKNGVTNK